MNAYSGTLWILLSFAVGITYIMGLAFLILCIKPDFQTRYGIFKRFVSLATTLGTMFICLHLVRDHHLSSFAAGLFAGMLGAAWVYVSIRYGIVNPADLIALMNGKGRSLNNLQKDIMVITINSGSY